MTLNPERYECSEHHTDLTEMVVEALEDCGPRIAYWGLRGRQAAGPEPFQVIVACPGTGGQGAHSLTCTGTQTR